MTGGELDVATSAKGFQAIASPIDNARVDTRIGGL